MPGHVAKVDVHLTYRTLQAIASSSSARVGPGSGSCAAAMPSAMTRSSTGRGSTSSRAWRSRTPRPVRRSGPDQRGSPRRAPCSVPTTARPQCGMGCRRCLRRSRRAVRHPERCAVHRLDGLSGQLVERQQLVMVHKVGVPQPVRRGRTCCWRDRRAPADRRVGARPRHHPPGPPRWRPGGRRPRRRCRSSMPAITSTSEIGSPSAQCATSGYRATAACHRAGSRSTRSVLSPAAGCQHHAPGAVVGRAT